MRGYKLARSGRCTGGAREVHDGRCTGGTQHALTRSSSCGGIHSHACSSGLSTTVLLSRVTARFGGVLPAAPPLAAEMPTTTPVYAMYSVSPSARSHTRTRAPLTSSALTPLRPAVTYRVAGEAASTRHCGGIGLTTRGYMPEGTGYTPEGTGYMPAADGAGTGSSASSPSAATASSVPGAASALGSAGGGMLEEVTAGLPTDGDAALASTVGVADARGGTSGGGASSAGGIDNAGVTGGADGAGACARNGGVRGPCSAPSLATGLCCSHSSAAGALPIRHPATVLSHAGRSTRALTRPPTSAWTPEVTT